MNKKIKLILKRFEIFLLKKLRTINISLLRKYIYYREKPILNDLINKYSEKYCTYNAYISFFVAKPKKYYKLLKRQNVIKGKLPVFKYNNSIYYNPVVIAQFGLAEYGFYISSRKEEHKHHFFNSCDSIIRNISKDTGALLYNFNYPNYGTDLILKAPWCSAMAQGQGMSLLSRAFIITGNKEYLKYCKMLINPLRIEIVSGGVKFETLWGTFYEEYPFNPPPMTLNGFIFCIIGLYDYSIVSNDKESWELFNKAILTLKNITSFYDSGFLSYYDLGHIIYPNREPLQGFKYHIIHYKQLYGIYDITKDEYFKNVADRWAKFK